MVLLYHQKMSSITQACHPQSLRHHVYMHCLYPHNCTLYLQGYPQKVNWQLATVIRKKKKKKVIVDITVHCIPLHLKLKLLPTVNDYQPLTIHSPICLFKTLWKKAKGNNFEMVECTGKNTFSFSTLVFYLFIYKF